MMSWWQRVHYVIISSLTASLSSSFAEWPLVDTSNVASRINPCCCLHAVTLGVFNDTLLVAYSEGEGLEVKSEV